MQCTIQKNGVVAALGTYIFWGLFPLYFKLLDSIAPGEILVHRVLWSFVFTFALVTAMRKWQAVIAVIRSWRALAPYTVSAILLSINWLIFIYAISIGDVLQLSLGYFLNPLFNMLLGFVVFRERLGPVTVLAIAMAFLGLCFQLTNLVNFPWLALGVALAFSIYGAVRKGTHLDSVSGLLVETAVLSPFALIFWLLFTPADSLNMMINSVYWALLLVLAGPLTSIPLITFSMAVKRIPYYLVGFCQYITPTLLFLLAVFLYRETWQPEDLATFTLVWLGILLILGRSLKRED